MQALILWLFVLLVFFFPLSFLKLLSGCWVIAEKEVNFYGPTLWLGMRTSKRGSSLTSQAAVRERRRNECCRVNQRAFRGAGRHQHLTRTHSWQFPWVEETRGAWACAVDVERLAPCKATVSLLSAFDTFSSSWQPHVFPWRSQHNWTDTACNRGLFTKSFHFHISIFKCWSCFSELSSALALSILSS